MSKNLFLIIMSELIHTPYAFKKQVLSPNEKSNIFFGWCWLVLANLCTY